MSKCQKDVKKMLNCQKDVKLSKRCQMAKSQTLRLCRRFTKKKIDIIRFTHMDVNLTSNMKVTKIGQNIFFAHFEGFWSPSYLTSKLMSMCVNLIMSIYFFMNLLHSPHSLPFWHLFDNLTHYLNLVSSVMGWGGLSYMSVSKCQKDVKFPYMLCACAWHHTTGHTHKGYL